MKQHYLLIFGLICFFSLSASEPVAQSYLVKQQIHYKCDNATEVYFFWGVNNWMKQDKNLWPLETVEKNGLLCTPMKYEDGVFSVELYAKPNTIIDYVFWITKGPKGVPSDIWDINKLPQKDYHSFAANDNITLINSKATVKPSRNLSILDFSGWLLITTLFVFLTAFLVRRYFLKNILIKPSLSVVILCVGFVVFVCGIFARPSVANFSWDIYNAPAGNFFRMLWMGYYDFIYVLFLTLFFFGLNYLFRNWPRVQKISFIVFLCLSLISVLSVILNIRVVEVLGKPFNYRWFYYSGFLNSADSKAAVASNLSMSYILSVIYILVVSVALSLLIIYLLEFIITRFRLRKVAIIIFICLNLGYLLKANSEIKDSRLNYDLVANPVAAFIESFSPFNKDPGLFTLALDDSLKFRPLASNRKTTLTADVSKIKNVILFVLESTPAEYVQPYDTKFKVTPTMERYLSNSVVFENIYAHAPATNKSMVCLLGSVYPWLSYTSITQEHPDVSMPTLSSELNKKGYRTAFFNSADNDFQRAGDFLSHRQFDVVKDKKNLNCSMHFEDKDHRQEKFDGIDDHCTADELISWATSNKDQPFFGVMWTYQTHYPYFNSGEKKIFTETDSLFNRYLNAVHHSDEALSKIIESLKAHNLFESTLVVVIGDHGEAFGRHNQTTHASKIYEENVHIPFVLINPAFNSERKNATGGTVDVAPTIMELLGIKKPQEWQGISLFAKNYNDRTYFFCPWSDYLFGFKEGDMKYIFNATKNTSEVYNIKNDPYETKDLYSLTSKQQIELTQQKLAAWAQYQDVYMKKLLK